MPVGCTWHRETDLPNIQPLAELPSGPARHSWHAAHNLIFFFSAQQFCGDLARMAFPEEFQLVLAPFVLSRIIKDLIRGD